MRTIDHFAGHLEWWPPGEPTLTVTVHWHDGSYTVTPAQTVGPFDVLDQVVHRATEGLDQHLSLW